VLGVLVASNRRSQRDVSGTIGALFFSAAFQIAIIFGAVFTTMQVAEDPQQINMDTIVLRLDEPAPEPEEQPDEPPPPVITSLNAPPKGFQVLMAPVDIPKEVPPVDLTQRFDPRDYSGVGVEGGVFLGVEGGVLSGVEGGTGPVELARVFQQAVVDERPEQLSCPKPQYPQMMQQAKVDGEVLMQFIVERDGHVERHTIEILSSTHRSFESPARDMIQRCLFRPGKVRSNSVRVLVQLPVLFVMHQR
jgi:protein TonB